jgi:hypothetical protein
VINCAAQTVHFENESASCELALVVSCNVTATCLDVAFNIITMYLDVFYVETCIDVACNVTVTLYTTSAGVA